MDFRKEFKEMIEKNREEWGECGDKMHTLLRDIKSDKIIRDRIRSLLREICGGNLIPVKTLRILKALPHEVRDGGWVSLHDLVIKVNTTNESDVEVNFSLPHGTVLNYYHTFDPVPEKVHLNFKDY